MMMRRRRIPCRTPSQLEAGIFGSPHGSRSPSQTAAFHRFEQRPTQHLRSQCWVVSLVARSSICLTRSVFGRSVFSGSLMSIVFLKP